MSKPKIYMCGASDLYMFEETFNQAIREMNCEPKHYFNASGEHNNLKTWDENSIKSIKDADIVVYVILNKYGSITWETEFATTLLEGKQFIVLCRAQLFDTYNELKGNLNAIENTDKDLYNLFNVIKELYRQQRTIAKFRENFSEVLKNEIIQIFSNGLELLNQQKGGLPIISAIENIDHEVIKDYTLNAIEEKILKKKLLDKSINKLKRKNILSFFEQTELSDDEIIELINETELAMPRKVVEDLPSIVKKSNDTAKIFKAIILKCSKNNRDIKVERLAVESMIKTNPKIALDYLPDLKPFRDIGTPKRILENISKNFTIFESLLNAKHSHDVFLKLVTDCKEYDPASNYLKSLHEDILAKLKLIK